MKTSFDPEKYLKYLQKNTKDLQQMIIQETDIIASIHLECTLSKPYHFPDPENDGDKISLISTTFHTIQNNVPVCIYESIIKYDPNNSTVNYSTDTKSSISCKEEKDIIIEWITLIKKMNTKVIIGWYIFGLDYIFIEKKAIKFSIDHLLGSMVHKTKEINDKKKFCIGSEIIKFDIMRYIESVNFIIGNFNHALRALGLTVPILSKDNLETYTLNCCISYAELFYKIGVIKHLKTQYEKAELYMTKLKTSI